MRIRTEHLFLEIGWQGWADLPYGFACGLVGCPPAQGRQRWRLIFGLAWQGRPTVTWRREDWDMSPAGVPQALQGHPASAWTGRRWAVAGWQWPIEGLWMVRND